jgi:hypothetical protein
VTATPPPGFRPVERRIAVPGVDLPVQWVNFVEDAHHALAWFEGCDEQHNKCRYVLGSTEDGGATWHRLNLPAFGTDRVTISPYPLNARTFTLYEVGKRYWLTTDGGATYKQYPLKSPPVQARLAATFPVAGSAFTVLCPGATGFEDGASGIECDREQLIRTGSGPVQPQPAIPGKPSLVTQGRDGRVWLLSRDGDRMRVAVSRDEARTWREIGAVSANAEVLVSPDGSDVWLFDTHPSRLWRVSGSSLDAQSNPPELNFGGVGALGGGLLAVGSESGDAGFWRDGVFTPIRGLRADGVNVLPEGSLVYYQEGAYVVGTGVGTDRTWVRVSST